MNPDFTLTVGSYVHGKSPRNYTFFSERKEERLSPRGRRIWYDVQWVLRTVLRRDTQAELTSAIEEYRAAHVNGADIRTYDGNSVAAAHSLISSATVYGTRFHIVEFPGIEGPGGPKMEYVNTRTLKTYVRAEVIDAEDTLVSYNQEIALVGHPTRNFEIIEGFFNPPVRQDTTLASRTAIVQSGRAVGLYDYPPLPATLYTYHLKPRPFRFAYGTPQRVGNSQSQLYPISWSYYYEAAGGIAISAPPESL